MQGGSHRSSFSSSLPPRSGPALPAPGQGALSVRHRRAEPRPRSPAPRPAGPGSPPAAAAVRQRPRPGQPPARGGGGVRARCSRHRARHRLLCTYPLPPSHTHPYTRPLTRRLSAHTCSSCAHTLGACPRARTALLTPARPCRLSTPALPAHRALAAVGTFAVPGHPCLFPWLARAHAWR